MRASGPLELESQVAVSCLTGCWEPNTGLLKKQPVLLTAESSLQSLLGQTVSKNYFVSRAHVGMQKPGLFI